jgi:hypothetical protein
MSRRPVLVAFLAALALLVVATSCASTGGGPTGPVGAPPPRIGAVVVDPREGPIGTTFTLVAKGLREGEAVAFEITFPGEGKAYPGAALTVPADGIATTSYRATTANQPGEYTVRLTGPPGSLAEGRFTVTDGPPITLAEVEPDTTAAGPSTTGRSSTTRTGRSTTSTNKAGASTTVTTVKASTTVTTVRRTTTTMPTGSSVKGVPTTG